MIPKTFEFKDSEGNIEYTIPLKYKVNILTGLTAVGKTELLNIISRNKANIGLSKCYSNIPTNKVLLNINEYTLKTISESREEYLIIFDEQNEITRTLSKQHKSKAPTAFNIDKKKLGNYVGRSKCVFIFITRNDLYLPLPQDAVLKLTTSNNGFTHTV